MRRSPRLLVLAATALFAQMQFADAQVFREYDHQPEVWHYPGPLDSNVDAGGDLSLSIPVLKVPGRELDFDVNFSYHAGIRVQQRASWIGLGWNFDPGSITRDVQGGVIHRYSWTGDRHEHADPPTVYYDVDFAGTDAYQPDAYFVHLPGGTYPMLRTGNGSFSTPSPTSQTSRFYVEEWQNWKIEPGAAATVTVDGWTTTSPDIPKFVVTTDDGARYVFEEKTLSRYDGVQISNPERYVDAWRLRAILAPDYTGSDIPSDSEAGSWIRFDYRYSTPPETRVAPKTLYTNTQMTQVTYLHKIVTPTHTAEFFTSPRMDLEVFQNPQEYYDDNAQEMYRNLYKIELRTRAGQLVRQVLLDQDQSLVETFFYNWAGILTSFLKTCSSQVGSGNQCAGRTTLKKVRFQDASGAELPGYSFAYASLNPQHPFVKTGTSNPVEWLGMDDYGYYNGGTTYSTSDPQIDSDTLDAHAWSLSKITYPTGGYERFVYGNDQIADAQIGYQYYFDHGNERQSSRLCPDPEASGCENESRPDTYEFNNQAFPKTRQGGVWTAPLG